MPTGNDATINDVRTLTGLLPVPEDVATGAGPITTGKISTMGDAILSPENDLDTEDVDESEIPGAEARPFDIGVVYDSAGDRDRLVLVTKYAGTKNVTSYVVCGRVRQRVVGGTPSTMMVMVQLTTPRPRCP